MGKILLNDILNLSEEEIRNTKLDLDMKLGKDGEKCLDYWLRTGEVTFGYHNPSDTEHHKVGQYVFAFAQMNKNTRWLLVSAGRVTAIPKKGTSGHCDHEPINDRFTHLEGRLIIDIPNKTSAMGRYCFRLSRFINSAEVVEILPKKYGGEPFPGYGKVHIKMRELKECLESTYRGEDWRSSLSAVKAVYCLNNHDEGKVYIGSAYNENGALMKRWTDYLETSHGNNVELRKLRKNKSEDYFLDNFYFSILEVFPTTTDKDAVIDREHHWMDVFNSRDPNAGYNRN